MNIALNPRIVKRLNEFLNELALDGEDAGEIVLALNRFAVEATMEQFSHAETVNHFTQLIELRRRKLAGELSIEGHA